MSEAALRVSISPGNKKMGTIPSFSLPPLKSCPGATEWCRKLCYAQWMEKYYRQTAKVAWAKNFELSRRDDFVDLALAAISKNLHVFRLHVSGDFYSVEYIEKWIKIASARPHTHFFAFTHCWNVPKLNRALNKLKRLPNVSLLASVDKTVKTRIDPRRWRVATLDHSGSQKPIGTIMCPHYIDKTQCIDCGLCWRTDKHIMLKEH